jgi:mannose-6-phosphate isomerase-like protein (cupin superfamily)
MRDIPALVDPSPDLQTPLRPAVVTPKQALSITPFGLDMDVLLTTEATGGATSVIVAWHKPGEGPPAHVHFKQEEILFIIEGLYEVTVDAETAKAGPGSIIFIPRNAVHRFKNVGGITGRMLGWSLPGGHDHYLKAISELAAGGGFTSEKVIEISKTFDTHFPVDA